MHEILERWIEVSEDEGVDLADIALELQRALDYVEWRIKEKKEA